MLARLIAANERMRQCTLDPVSLRVVHGESERVVDADVAGDSHAPDAFPPNSVRGVASALSGTTSTDSPSG